jgi:hypothetical protein
MDDQRTTMSDEVSLRDLAGWFEFGCWTTLALCPVLYYVNGPAVSHDQFIVRTGLVVMALAGAVPLLLRRWWIARLQTRKSSD